MAKEFYNLQQVLDFCFNVSVWTHPHLYILYFCISVSAESVCSWSWSIWVWLDPSDQEAVLINYFPAHQPTAAHKLWPAFRNAGMSNRNVFVSVFVYLYICVFCFPARSAGIPSDNVCKLKSRNVIGICWEDYGIENGFWWESFEEAFQRKHCLKTHDKHHCFSLARMPDMNTGC